MLGTWRFLFYSFLTRIRPEDLSIIDLEGCSDVVVACLTAVIPALSLTIESVYDDNYCDIQHWLHRSTQPFTMHGKMSIHFLG